MKWAELLSELVTEKATEKVTVLGLQLWLVQVAKAGQASLKLPEPVLPKPPGSMTGMVKSRCSVPEQVWLYPEPVSCHRPKWVQQMVLRPRDAPRRVLQPEQLTV